MDNQKLGIKNKKSLNKQVGIRKKIISHTISTLVVVSFLLVCVISYFMAHLTNGLMLDNLRPMAKTASQSIENNLHMMVDRLFMISENPILTSKTTSVSEKQSVINQSKSGIEFMWLALYNADGSLYTGSESSPIKMPGNDLYNNLKETENLVIDDTQINNNQMQIVIGTPIMQDSKVSYYLVGSYKYDVLNDVLSNINVGKEGTAFIINENGVFMAHQDTTKIAVRTTIYDIYGNGRDIQNLAEQMKQGQTGSVGTGAFYDKQYFSYSPVRGTNWSLGITAPQHDFMGDTNSAILMSILITIIIMIFSIIPTRKLASQIQRPLGRVTDRIAQLSDGDLHSPVDVEETKDETEVLSRALNETVDSINNYTSELSKVLGELSKSNLDISVNGEFNGDFIVMKDSLNKIVNFLNQIMRAIQQAAIQVSSTSHMVSTNAMHVRESSSSQADSLNELERESQNISASINVVNSHTENVNGLMQEAMERLKEARENMSNMLRAMDAISKSSEEITKINKFLEDIAFQTNILALNASVEAARAGAAGHGFAIVATEVRELAAKSGESSKKTSQMIQASKSAAEEGANYAEAMDKSIQDIYAITKEISSITTQLEQAVDSEKASLDTITDQISSINELAQLNLSSSEESALASQELTEQADQLQSMANRFKLRD